MKSVVRICVIASVVLITACAGNKGPTTAPGQPDPYLKAATQAGAIVNAVQSAEIVFYNAGSSGLSASDQATVQKVFADTSKTVVNAIDAYAAAKTAPTKQAMVDAIVTGVNNIILTFAKFSNSQFKAYTAWVNTAFTLVDLLVPGTAARSAAVGTTGG